VNVTCENAMLLQQRKNKMALFAMASAAAIFATWEWRRRGNGLRIKEIFIYPIKSCGSIQLKSSACDKLGLQYDRFFYFVSICFAWCAVP
jgi:hypothetical protein